MNHQNFVPIVNIVLCKSNIHISYHFDNSTSQIVSDEHKWTIYVLCRNISWLSYSTT